MKLTKKLLEQYIRKAMKESAYTQLELPMEMPPAPEMPSPEEAKPEKPQSTAKQSLKAEMTDALAHKLIDKYFESEMVAAVAEWLDLSDFIGDDVQKATWENTDARFDKWIKAVIRELDGPSSASAKLYGGDRRRRY